MMKVPEHLHINGRGLDQNFTLQCKLFRSFRLDELDQQEHSIILESIKFPDISCNWDRYSVAQDIKFRRNGKETDGCYSITVETAKFEEIALPVHDPINDSEYPNYAHVEIRIKKQTDPQDHIPEKGRKLNSKSKKMMYRQNLANKALIEFMAIA